MKRVIIVKLIQEVPEEEKNEICTLKESEDIVMERVKSSFKACKVELYSSYDMMDSSEENK